MSNTVIKVEGLSKQYRLGQIGTGSLAHDINRWWYRVRGMEDPYLKIGDSNDRTTKGESEYVWALRDIDFKVNQGDVLGIIGRNGAGKSTLLKILSRTTSPTKGEVKIRGRVASLLEVGTGFHPELTGRDNIFLNGAILGMRRQEVMNKFDAIVDFAGVERYIDTPVKRYSSGMYVRLAFGVAAFLEPDILIIDEVLAVGDAEFQKKCLGKMNDVSQQQGRTVLFVSHNMTAIQSLCRSVLFLENGKINAIGKTKEVVDMYLKRVITNEMQKEWNNIEAAPGNEAVRIKSISAIPVKMNPYDKLTVETPINLSFEFWNLLPELSFNLSMHVYDSSGEVIFATVSPVFDVKTGIIKLNAQIPGNLFNDGGYYISMMIVKDSKTLFFLEEAISFEVFELPRSEGWLDKWPGYIRPKFNWTVAELNQVNA
jgi:lipopolysaccharide transport system ATP-binding protein